MSNENDSQDLTVKKPRKKTGGFMPGGGRPKGSKNKPKECVAEICERLGFNPFEFLANVGKGDWEELGLDGPKKTIMTKAGVEAVDAISLDQRLKAASELAPHIAPLLKAVELSGQVDTTSEADRAAIDEMKSRLAKINE